jgi:hypothetical protein
MKAEELIITLKDKEGNQQQVEIHITEIIEQMGEYIYEKLEDMHHKHCTNESIAHCECERLFEDYEIQEYYTLTNEHLTIK